MVSKASIFRLLFLLLVVPLLLAILVSACAGPPEAHLVASVTGGRAPLSVSFTNSSKNSTEFRWEFGDGDTATTNTQEERTTHKYTKAGTHTVTLTAIKKGEPPQSGTATTTVTVESGPLDHVKIEPSAATVEVTNEQQFTVTALDQFDNPIPNLWQTFQVEEQVGKLESGGKFTAGNKAGLYEKGVIAKVIQGSTTRTATARVTIKPGPLEHVVMQPGAATLEVTKEQQFTAIAFDPFDNPIPGLIPSFQSDPQAGRVDSGGKFTAGTKVGAYASGVTAKATQGNVTKTAAARITIKPGPLDRLKLEPSDSTVLVTKEQQFTATPVDRFDNPILGLIPSFQSDFQAGLVDSGGKFTAGTKPGAYASGVTAKATQGSVAKTATARITIKPGLLDRLNLQPFGGTVLVTGDGLTLAMETAQPTTGRPVRFYLSGLPTWKPVSASFLNPLNASVEWTSEDETFIVDQGSQRIKTNTLYADGNGRASWARLNALDNEGLWTVQVVLDNKQYVGRYTLVPLQLPTSPFNDLGISMRRYSGSSSEVYLSSGVPLSLALDLSGFLPPLTEKLKPWVNVSSVQIPSLYLFSNSDLFRRGIAGAGATDVGPFAAGIYKPSGRYRGVYATLHTFNSETIKTVIHEYVHLLVAEAVPTADVPAWLNEGLAKYLENRISPDFGASLTAQRAIFFHADLVKARLSGNSLIPLARLVSQRDWNAQTDPVLVSLQYSEAYMAVRYLTERFGNQSVALILSELQKTKSFETSFSAVTETTLGAFEQDWLSWLRKWQDPTREQVRQYVVQASQNQRDIDGILSDRGAFIKSPAGSGPFAQRVPTQTQFVDRATKVEARGLAVTPPSQTEDFHADLVTYLSTVRTWLQHELSASLAGNNSLQSQANVLIPEVNGRANLLSVQLSSIRFNYGLGSE